MSAARQADLIVVGAGSALSEPSSSAPASRRMFLGGSGRAVSAASVLRGGQAREHLRDRVVAVRAAELEQILLGEVEVFRQ